MSFQISTHVIVYSSLSWSGRPTNPFFLVNPSINFEPPIKTVLVTRQMSAALNIYDHFACIQTASAEYNTFSPLPTLLAIIHTSTSTFTISTHHSCSTFSYSPLQARLNALQLRTHHLAALFQLLLHPSLPSLPSHYTIPLPIPLIPPLKLLRRQHSHHPIIVIMPSLLQFPYNT